MAETEKYPIWQDRIVTDPLILAGKPTIKGTRNNQSKGNS